MSGTGAHPVLLRAPSFRGVASRAPLILHRTESEFVPAVISELSSETTVPSLLRTVASHRDANRRLKLFQPLQRAFNLAVLEVVCDRPDYPRFDPDNVVSAGLVVRRVTRDRPDQLEGWRQDGTIVRGWVPFGARAEEDLDPDPAFRKVVRYGHQEVDARLAALRAPSSRMSESFEPAFTMPPEVALAVRKTILLGAIPVASSEESKAPAGESFPDSQLRSRLSPYLRATTMPLGIPRARTLVRAGDLTDVATREALAPYTNMLRQLVHELDAFGDSVEARALFAALNRVNLPYGTLGSGPRYTVPAGASMRQHAEVLVHRKEQPTRVAGESWPDYPAILLPNTWPRIDAATANAIAAAAKRVLDKRLPAIKGDQPRFGEKGRLYRVRAFARVAHEAECVHTVWSDYSEPFVIAPWYEGYGAPPIQVSLPGLDELAALAKKPNVTVSVPGDIACMLQQNDALAFLKGEGKKCVGIAIDFICSFSLPVITLCAFIVLNIFLSLFDLFLGWLKFGIMLCIPVPRPTSAPPAPAPPAGP